jgi:hypothetical protein
MMVFNRASLVEPVRRNRRSRRTYNLSRLGSLAGQLEKLQSQL